MTKRRSDTIFLIFLTHFGSKSPHTIAARILSTYWSLAAAREMHCGHAIRCFSSSSSSRLSLGINPR